MYQFITIRLKHNCYKKIYLKDIIFIESNGHYVKIFTSDSFYLTEKTLAEIERLLKSKNFRRVHRQYIVNVLCFDNIIDNMIILGDKTIPLSRQYRGNLFEGMIFF
jgi:DNA-binding LytR/AlgR family response regulator